MMIEPRRLKNFAIEGNCYKCGDDGCPTLKEVAMELLTASDILRMNKQLIKDLQSKLHKRNAQSKRLKKEIQECYAEIAQLVYKINNR